MKTFFSVQEKKELSDMMIVEDFISNSSYRENTTRFDELEATDIFNRNGLKLDLVYL